jgi:macrolide transport system ATP-binding/permease protein
VSSGYFATLGSRILRGRGFREDEDASKPHVIIVNRTLANKYFTGVDPIGKQIYYDWNPRSPIQIIGIIEDIREGPLEGRSSPAAYVPFNQNPATWFAVLARTSEPEAVLFPHMAAAIHGIDPFISVSGQATMTERINQSPSAYLHRSAAGVAGAFAAAAFVLSVTGLYGVIAYSVSQRTREIGIRMALGAERVTLYRLILKEAGRLAAFGVVLGIACSLAAATLLRGLLFGVRPWDLPTLAAVAGSLGISALLASYIPARRAASVNPAEALRAE